jgi:16S rRNA (uracil1498-N3)-methyltransferase
VEQPLGEGRQLELPPEALRHAVSVLRLRDGAECRVFDGRGSEHQAILELVGRRSGFVRLGPLAASPTTPRRPLRLLQGVARGEHMDLAIQKAVELGVSEIWPVLTIRSRSGAAHRNLDSRVRHWHGVLRSAAEQCGRNELPALEPPRDFEPALAALPTEDLRFLADASGDSPGTWRTTLSIDPGTSITLLVGPEGGLEPDERNRAHAAGFRGLAMGPRVLRTETAAIAGLTILQTLYGDLD